MFSMVDLIKNKTDDFFTEMKSKLEIVSTIQDYIDNIKSIFYNGTEKFTSKESKESEQNLFSKISSAWNKVQKQLYTVIYGDGLKFDESKDIEVEKETSLRRWPIFIMLSSAIVCLSFSTIFHWFGGLSPVSSQILSRLDYAGITILIAGSCNPPYFYFFYLKCIYAPYISVLFPYSQSLFLSTHLPQISMCQSADVLEVHCFLPLVLARGFLLFIWFFLEIMYLNRIPEKFVPRTFDYFGASHQIFHLLVVVGVVLHYCGSLNGITIEAWIAVLVIYKGDFYY